MSNDSQTVLLSDNLPSACVKEREAQHRADAAMWTRAVKMPSRKCQAITQEVKIRLKVLFGERVELWTQSELHLQTHTERNYSSDSSNIPGKQEDLRNQRHTAMKQMYITPVFHISSIFHSPLNKEHKQCLTPKSDRETACADRQTEIFYSSHHQLFDLYL